MIRATHHAHPFRKLTPARLAHARERAGRVFEQYVSHRRLARLVRERAEAMHLRDADTARAEHARGIATELDRRARHLFHHYSELQALIGLYELVLTDRADTIRAWQDRYPYTRLQVAEMLHSVGASDGAIHAVLRTL